MNSIEDRLRDAYRGAADTVRPDRIRRLDEQSVLLGSSRGARHRPAPRRILIPLSAAASIALVGILAGALAGVAGRTPSRPPLTGSPAGRFLVVVSGPGKHSLSIHNKFTGASVATIAAPRPGMKFTALATGDGRHYVAVLWRKGVCRSWIYQFQLDAAGQPGALTPYALATSRQLLGPIAVSPDNSTFAYAGKRCDSSSSTAPSELAVVKVATLAARTWSIPGQISVASMSLTAHGRRLAYSFGPSRRYGSGVYVLRTDAAPGSALQRSSVVAKGTGSGRYGAIYSGAITPDGGDVYYIASGAGSSYGRGWQVRMADLVTGKIRVVGVYPGIPGYLMPGPAVRHALVAVLSPGPTPVPTSSEAYPSAAPSTSAALPSVPPTTVPGRSPAQSSATPSPSSSSPGQPSATPSAAPSTSPGQPSATPTARPSSSPPARAPGTAAPAGLVPSPSPAARPYAVQLYFIFLFRAVPGGPMPVTLRTAEQNNETRILRTGHWNPAGIIFAW